jgi:hypothetical protein
MPIPVKIATVRIDGVAYEGIYYVQGSTVFVESPFGAKAIQIAARGGRQDATVRTSAG